MLTLSELRSIVKKDGVPYVNLMDREELESFADKEEHFSLGWRWKYIHPVLTSHTEARGVYNMLTSDVRDLTRLRIKDREKVSQFLSKHKVIITLTTSPLRLPKITAVLATLDLTYVSRINVVLPMGYGPKKEQYGNIPEHVTSFPKVKIVRIVRDLGPITKLLPTVTRSRDKSNLVISVDDDVCYPMGMVNEMIYHKVCKYPTAAITMGVPMPFFTEVKNMRKYWPENHQRRPYIDIVEGWSSVVYDPKNVNDKCMLQLSKLSKQCLLSDDFVISYALSQAGIKRAIINNRYAFNPFPYEYGAGEDALHAGKGLDGKKSYTPHSDEINFEKYTQCLKDIQDYVRAVQESKTKKDYCGFRG